MATEELFVWCIPLTCWNCENDFVPGETRWVASSAPGEMVLAYVCPCCEHAQYGVEVFREEEKSGGSTLADQANRTRRVSRVSPHTTLVPAAWVIPDPNYTRTD